MKNRLTVPRVEGKTWYTIRNAQRKPRCASIFIYEEIGGWGINAQEFAREFMTLGDDISEIDLHINSPGGDVFDGIAIRNLLKAHKATVTTYVDGLAASIASVIALAGDKVIMGRNSTMMIHDASGLCIGQAQDMQAMAELLEKTSDNIAQAYADKAGNSRTHWRDLMRAETWFSDEETVTAGLADEVADMPDVEDPDIAAKLTRKFPVEDYGFKGKTSDDDEGSTIPQLLDSDLVSEPLPGENTLSDMDLATIVQDTFKSLGNSEEEAIDYDPDIIRASVEHAVNHAPALPDPQISGSSEPDNDDDSFIIDPADFINALKGAFK